MFSLHYDARMNQGKGTVCVGLSGGVDSSVAAKRLIDAGYEVIGVFIKTWQPDFIPCNWQAERLDAMRVAAHLNIPFYTCDAVDSYRDDVAMYMIEEYKKGRTPNPDVMCNKYVKFGTFLNFAQKHGVPMIATGHYARVVSGSDGRFHLIRGVDISKDQSYFLWTLTQEQLSHTLFPVGDSVKAAIRDEATLANLMTSKKRDSQGVCFLGQFDMREFLSHYIHSTPGAVIDEQGNVIGNHTGALFYTLGQRHGFTITARCACEQAQYIIARDIEHNTLTVSNTPVLVHRGNTFEITECNFIVPHHGVCEAQFRYRQKPFKVTLEPTGNSTARVTIDDTQDIELPSLGQSAVFYMGDICLGGGIISSYTM